MAKSKKSTAVIEDEVEDLELDEVEDDEETETAPSKKGKAAAEEVTFGVRELAEYISKRTKKTIQPRDLRTLIRKMAREEKPRVNREIIPGNKQRYSWADGLEDPEVKRIIKAVVGGELEEGKREALEALKAKKAAKDAAAGKGAKAGGKKGKKAKVVDEDEDTDTEVEDLDLDEDEDE